MQLAEPDRTPLDLNFRLFGTDVRIHPLFWLITLLLGWRLVENPRPWLPGNGFGDLGVWVACAFVSILLHEFGHIWMGRAFGADGYILLHGMGGLAIGSGNVRRRWQRILVSFAGPAIQLLLFAALFGMVALGYRPEERSGLDLALVLLLEINLFWPLLNLLPIWPLDGGQITRDVCLISSRRNGALVSLFISFGLATVLALNAFFPFLPRLAELSGHRWLVVVTSIISGNWWMGIFFALFAVGSFQLLQAEMQQRRSPWDDDRLPWER